MSAKKFLDLVEQQALLSDSVVAKLRRQIEQSQKSISAESVAKLLIQNGHLTKFQAKKLVADAKEEGDEDDEDVVMLEPAAGAGGTDSASTANDDLDLLDDDTPAEPAPQKQKQKPAPAASDDLTPLDDDDDGGGLTPLDDDDGGLTPLGDEGLEPLDAPPASGGLDPLPAEGGLEELGSDPMADPFAEASQEVPEEASQPKGPKKKTVRANIWDSPLLLAGGASLLILLLLSGFLYFSLTRGNASEVFQAAETDYRNQAYTQAIDKYEQFLKSYSADPNAGLARVRINMAKIRQAVEGSSDPNKGLEAANKYLPEIQEEESFNEARDELATLLPDIADGFAQKAKVAARTSYGEAEALLDKAAEAMELVDNPLYIPASLRKGLTERLRSINELIAEVRRNIDRDKKLEATLAAMREAIKSDDTREAYTQREKLLSEYPGLAAHEELIAVVREITDKQQALVTTIQPQLAPAGPAPGDAGLTQVVLAARSGNPIPDIEGHVAYILIQGGIYGIDASTGEPLWRRFVGETAVSHPVPVSDQPGADALAVDAAQNALLRLGARTGEVVWRLPIGEAIREPTLVDDHAFAATESGKLLKIDLASGEIVAAAQLPAGATPPVSPAGSTGRPAVYQVADHDNFYALDAESLDAKEVYYLGHQSGTVAVAPVSALGYVFIPENAGGRHTTLHILKTDREGTGLVPAQSPLRLDGNVVVRPTVDGRRVTILTDLGAVYVYNVNPQHEENASPVTPAVDPLVATNDSSMVSYFKVDDTQLWIGDTRLAKYDIQLSRQKLNRQWSENLGAVFVAPMHHFGNALIQVRRPLDASGVTVSAINDNDFKQTLWKLELAVPTLEVFLDNEQVRAVSTRGSLFTIDDQAQDKQFAGATAQSDTNDYVRAMNVGDGKLACFSPSGRLLVYDPQRSRDELRALRLSLQTAVPTADPIGFADGVLIPLNEGEVVLLDPASGTNKLLPFHPQLAAGQEVQWLSPAPLPSGDQFAIADNRNNLFLVGIQPSGQPHLAEVNKTTVNEPLLRTLAVAGDTIYGVVRGGSGDEVVSYSLPKLEPGKKWKLNGRIHWGPQAVGDSVFVASETDGLLCLGPGQTQRWVAPLPHGAIAAAPVAVGSNFMIASKAGVVWIADGSSGEELASSDLSQPLAGTPVIHQNQIYVATADGTIVVAPMPQ